MTLFNYYKPTRQYKSVLLTIRLGCALHCISRSSSAKLDYL